MAGNTVPDQVVASPTYMADIRFYFRPEDVDHMSAKGIDLGTYDGVKRNALAVFAHTAPPNADMPPDPAGKWSAERSQTFKNWIVNGYPLGTATPPVGTATPPDPGSSGTLPDRLRKNVTSLSTQEIQTLRTAFTGLMGRPPGDADSYFALAGNHGLPQAWCMHHEDPFIPGSFAVKLLADGEPIAKRAFFQPKSPRNCENCRKHALINIDFRIEREKLLDRRLSVEIEVLGHGEIGARFPLSQAGNPTINARLLLEDE